MSRVYHIPVLLEASVNGLDVKPGGLYVDLTFGGGGHSKLIAERLGGSGRLLAFDQDKDAIENALDFDGFQMVYGNFSYLYQFLKYYRAIPVDGILADLGVSSHHFDAEQRGFSFRFDAPLDMRMNQKAEFSAFDVVNTYGVKALSDIFYQYGELKNAWSIAQTLEKHRSVSPIKTTFELCSAIEKNAPKHQEHKFFAKVFQALRIEVNQEMEALKEMLKNSARVLKPGGRLVVITYHSLEDRLVKNFIKTGTFEGKVEKDFYGNVNRPFEELNRKVIVPDEAEVERNNRARSAKLRIAVRKEEEDL
ncbi:MAG: 16S rRNA (cytosine(1402)-N(4))-methyltransferase RsmH [Bacteroidales bacterium]|nr:16S rRNA (cytosine(1402)-N(4))-methyltransferase RsmH [Bacteroidales bacterium]